MPLVPTDWLGVPTHVGAGQPSPDLLAVTIVGSAESSPQSRFLVHHYEQVRHESERGAVRKKHPGFIEQRRPSQGEGRAKIHWVANKQIRSDNDQAPRRIERGGRSAADHNERDDAP